MAHAPHAPWWAAVSALAAPLLLIGGWTCAADEQPRGYSAIADTISTLASYGAVDRWIMTYTFLALGVSVLVTALGLRTAALPGRMLLAAGGIAAALIAFFPQPAEGSSVKHIAIACFAFVALAFWPVLAWRRGERIPHPLRPQVSIAVAGVLLSMCCWYVIELHGNGATLGLAERIVAACQAVWLMVVAIASTRLASKGTTWRISRRTNALLGRGSAAANGVLGLPAVAAPETGVAYDGGPSPADALPDGLAMRTGRPPGESADGTTPKPPA